MSTWNQLVLETLGSRLIMPKIFLDTNNHVRKMVKTLTHRLPYY